MEELAFLADNGVQVKYKHKPSKYDFKHIIFVFSGFHDVLPGNYDFIQALDNCPCDVVWINDDFEGMYSYYLCINMNFKVEVAVTQLMRSFLENKKLSLDNITVTGFSKGGTAALYYGLKLNISNIVITVPQIYIGDYLENNWKGPAKHMMGIDYPRTKIHYLNNLIPNLLKNDNNLKRNIYLLTSEADEQYYSHISPVLLDLSKYSNFNLLKTFSLFVRQHNQVTAHHTSLLLSIYYAIASEAVPRFNNGEVNFFGSQPIAHSEPSLKPFVDLHKIDVIDNRLFLEGVALLEGVDVENYSDISYELIFKGSKNYSKNLAKDNKPHLTRKYFQDEIVIYDKCWFTTYNYKGIDVSDIDKGNYEIYIRIKIRKYEEVVKVNSTKAFKKLIGNIVFNINSTDSSVVFS